MTVLVGDVAWADERSRVHLVTDGRVAYCGRPMEDEWISRPRGLFFKQRELPSGDELCQACLDESGGRGPINRRRR